MRRTIDIDEKVDNGKCPADYWCVWATTGGKNERDCLKCWIKYCKENNLEISYESVDKRVGVCYN